MKNSKILITGADGFVGGHLVAEFRKAGYRKLIMPSFLQYNLTEPARVRAMLRRHRPEAVIHLAARVGGIGANRAHPGSFLYDNLVMGVHLMEESRRCRVKKFVFLGTVCGYPKFTPVPFKEKDLWNGYPEETNAPYGLAKKMMLVQSQGYREEYGFNSIFLVPVNMYGPGDHFDLENSHVIPVLIRKFIEAKERGESQVVLWGDGSPSREFLYAGDCARAIRLAFERYDKSDPVNIGTGREIKIRDLASLIGRKVGFKGKVVWDTTKPNGQPRRCLDISRAKKEFDFVAKTSFEDGLDKTIAWFRKNRKKCT